MVESQIVGKYSRQGVLAYGGQDLGAPCRRTIGDNDHPQALWFFSVNARGANGFGNLTVRGPRLRQATFGANRLFAASRPQQERRSATWFLGLESRARPIHGLPSSRCMSHSAQINCNFHGIRRLKTGKRW
jgi:hypothetical protein